MNLQPPSADSFPPQQPQNPTVPLGSPTRAGSFPTVLIVEDNEDNLLLLVHTLEVLNCQTLTATNGESAIALARQHQPDLILADIMLPTLDGFELIAQLQRWPETQEIPMIAVTAMARVEDQERIMAAGFREYLSKPYLLDDIQALVDRYIP